MSGLERADRAVGATLRWVCIALMSALFYLIAENVALRGLGFGGRPWYDEIIELTFAWLAMIGAAAVWRERGHFVVDLLGDLAPGSPVARLLRALAATISLAVLATLTWRGWDLAARATATSPVLGAPRAIWYACLPASGALMTVYALRDLLAALRGR